MASRYQLPGMRWFLWMRIASLRTGILTGIYLSCVFVAWLDVANRAVELERYAGLRNLVAGSVLIIIMGIPVLRFRSRPGKLLSNPCTAEHPFSVHNHPVRPGPTGAEASICSCSNI